MAAPKARGVCGLSKTTPAFVAKLSPSTAGALKGKLWAVEALDNAKLHHSWNNGREEQTEKKYREPNYKQTKLVGAIGFEPTRPQPFQSLAGLGWQPKDRNGSQRNNYWTWIGHFQLRDCRHARILSNVSEQIAQTNLRRSQTPLERTKQ